MAPTLQEAREWLSKRSRFVAQQASENAILVFYLSTHGFEKGGELYFALRDADRVNTDTMLSLAEIDVCLNPFLKGKSERRVVLLLQTCRETLDPKETPQQSLEEVWQEREQWSVFFAAKSGKKALGNERRMSAYQEFFGEAFGKFTKVLLEKWKEQTKTVTLENLAKQILQEFHDEQEQPYLVGAGDVQWPPLGKAPPPQQFRDLRWIPIDKKEDLIGRDRFLFSALGNTFDPETERPGWLSTTLDVVCMHGASGSGKSSLVRGGFLPRLKSSIYVDLSTEDLPSLPSLPPKDAVRPIVFLDQIEGSLTDTTFQKVIRFIEQAKASGFQTFLLVRTEAEPEFQRLWYHHAPQDWGVDFQVVEPFTETEAFEVIDASLPTEVVNSLPYGWKSCLLEYVVAMGRGVSPALLQLALWDLCDHRKIRPLAAIWSDLWNTITAGVSKTETLAVISAFCPLEEGLAWQKRRVLSQSELLEWFGMRGLSKEPMLVALQHLQKAHWLTTTTKYGESAFLLSHDLLQPFFVDELHKDQQERTSRAFARRVSRALSQTDIEENTKLSDSLREEFKPSEWKKLLKDLGFWYEWITREALEGSEHSFRLPTQAEVEESLRRLLDAKRQTRARIWAWSTTVGILFLLAGLLWGWKARVEAALLAEMEVCTQTQENLQFKAFQRCTKALVKAEQWWGTGKALREKIFKLFETFQAKKMPRKWCGIVPSSLEVMRDLFAAHFSSKKMAMEHWKAWSNLLQCSLNNAGRSTLTKKELSLLSSYSTSHEVRRIVLEVWKEWIENGGKASLSERSAWNQSLQDPSKSVRRHALEVWEAWFKHGGKASLSERSAWNRILKDANYSIRSSTSEVWKAWVENGGKANASERNAWLLILKDSDVRVRMSAVRVWVAWFKYGGKARKVERSKWLNMLKDSAPDVRWNALAVWEAWVKNGGKANTSERNAWFNTLKDSNARVRRGAVEVLKAWFKYDGKARKVERNAWPQMLKDSDARVRRSAVEGWEAWVKNGEKANTSERNAWLNMLKDSDGFVRMSAVRVWVAWFKYGGKARKVERSKWLDMLKDSAPDVRWNALAVWEAWVKNGGKANTSERNAWLFILKDSDNIVRKNALAVWKAWVKNGGKANTSERNAWLFILKDSAPGVRWNALAVWEAWVKNSGKANTSERNAWLNVLKNSDEDEYVHRSALDVWEAFVKGGGKASLSERRAWFQMLKHSNDRVRDKVLKVWEAWGEKSMLQQWKQVPRSGGRFEAWLSRTLVWEEVEGGMRVLQERLALEPDMARELQASRYPLLQKLALEVLAKQTKPSASRPSTNTTSQRTPPLPPTSSRPITRPSTATAP